MTDWYYADRRSLVSLLLLLGLLAGGVLHPTTSLGQEREDDDTLRPQAPDVRTLKRPTGAPLQKPPIQTNEADHESAQPTAVRSQAKVAAGSKTLTPQQSFVLSPNPYPDLNIDLRGTPRYAGDVNGDGTNDYVYTAAAARDERSQALEDVTGKTALFFGGTPSETEDQLLYQQLHPAGDLNNDGHADAVRLDSSDVRIYEGTTSGYQDTGVTLTGSDATHVRGFTDLDNDGIDDLLVGADTSDTFSVVYGASSVSNLVIQTYTLSSPDNWFRLNVADLDGAGGGEIVRLTGQNEPGVDTIRVQVYSVSTAREVQPDQEFKAEELDGTAAANQLSLINIDGAGQKEIVTKAGVDTTSYVFIASSGTYSTTPDSLGITSAVPVGDLDADGRHDFYTVDPSTSTPYISFGPSTASGDLTYDTEIPFVSTAFGRATYIPQSALGDVTGDGDPDAVLGYFNWGTESVGRRFFSVNLDRTVGMSTDVTYPHGSFDDLIAEANAVGDVNNDGATDFAVVRTGQNKIDVFFGGLSISDQPDLTLNSGIRSNYTTVSGGDVNGDGVSDIVAGYNTGTQIDVYLGSKSPDPVVDHVIDPADFGLGAVYFPRVVGDINNDGVSDLVGTDLGFFASQQASAQKLAVFFGGSLLPSTPDQVIDYSSGQWAGWRIIGPGDVNGDGVDDFVVARPFFDDGSTATGRADVYYGASAPLFDTPDLIIRPPDLTSSVRSFSHGLTGGDFNGDGAPDLAIRSQENPNDVGISLYYGGSTFNDTRDQTLPVPSNTKVGGDPDGDGFSEQTNGALVDAGDVDDDGADDLVLGSGGDDTNALLYRPSIRSDTIQVLQAPNQDATLGGLEPYHVIASGDFTGDGASDVVLTQNRDNNDAAVSSRLYRYRIAQPSPTASLPSSSLRDTLAVGTSNSQSIQLSNTASNAEDLRYEMAVILHEDPSSKRAPEAQQLVSGGNTWPDAITAVDATSTTLAAPKAAGLATAQPPLLVDDPVSDADTTSVNVAEVHAGVSNGRINVIIEHTGPVDSTNYSGSLSLDVDQDTSTGTRPIGANTAQTLGSEYAVLFDNLDTGSVLLADTETHDPQSGSPPILGQLPADVDTSAVHFAIPLSVIDGSPPFHATGVVGTSTGPTDWFPNSGNVTIGPSWLSVSPASGSIASGQSQTVDVSFTATGTPPGQHEGRVRILTSDPTQDTTRLSASLSVERPAVTVRNPNTPPTPGSATSIDVTLPSEYRVTKGTFFYQRAGAHTFRDTTYDLSGIDAGGTTSLSIPGSAVTKAGVRYYLQLTGPYPDGSGSLRLTVPSTAPTTTRFVGAQAKNIGAKGAFRARTYRMLTVPLHLGDRSVFGELKAQYGTYDVTNWRLARWSPSDSTYNLGTNVDSLRPGQAAWLVTSQSDSLIVSGGQSVDASGPYPIPLEPGWNQIGNPYPFPVAWEDVRRPAAVRPPFAHTPNGYRADVKVLLPWRGVFVYNNADSTVTIQVPPVDTSIAKTGAKRAKGQPLATASSSADGYRLQATAKMYRDGELWTDGATSLGFSDQAEATFGPKDRAKPPGIGPHLRLHIRQEDGPALARSLKPPTEEGAAWDLEVGLHANEPLSSSKEVSIHLAEHGTRPTGFKRYVIDRDRGRRLPITNGSVSVTLSKDHPTRDLRVIVGTESFARSKSDGAPLSIEQTRLRPNAPNPFTGSTTIHYQLAEKERVRITIFDVLGRQVRTLVDRSQRAGVHSVKWAPKETGRSLASGVYFCRMEAGSYTGTRKMVLVR